MTKEYIRHLLNLGEKNIQKLIVTIVCNVDGLTNNFVNYTKDSVESEFLTVEQYELILSSLRNRGFETNSYFDEDKFMTDYLTNKFYVQKGKQNLIMNSAQKGIAVGRKSLIPAFCDLYGIWHNNSDAYTVSLCRNKFHLYCILSQLGFPRPKSWLYNFKNGGWLNGKSPEHGREIIAKLNYETSSIGLSEKNILIMSKDAEEYIKYLSINYNQAIIVQDFICGYEVEVPVILSKNNFVLDAMCVVHNKKPYIGNVILDYDIRKYHDYEYSSFDSIDILKCKELKDTALKIATFLNISGLGRIDFRLDNDKNIYITDIATNPGISKYTATYNAIKQFGYSYEDMLCFLIGMTIDKYS